MSRRFEIVITEFVQETTLTRAAWTKGCGDAGEDNYGYSPQIEQQEIVERKVYTQNVDQLDLVKVIKAVNEPPAQVSINEIMREQGKSL